MDVKRISRILFLVLCLISCSKETFEVSSRYSSVAPKEIGIFYKLKYSSFAIGSELQLYTDQKFLYTTCGIKKTGTWKKSNDSLYLYCESSEFRHFDSIATCLEKPEVFKIKRNFLERKHLYGNSKIMIEKLKKVEEEL